jgi:hypothetical protein
MPLTEYEWYATVSDGVLTTTGPIWRFMTESEPPVTHVGYPVGGETLTVGQSATLQWVALDDVEVTSIDIFLSRTGVGGAYEPIATGIQNTGAYEWMVSGPETGEAFLKVVSHDGDGHATADVSDAAFVIRAVTGIGEDRVMEFALDVVTLNPSRGSVSFSVAVPTRSGVRISIYDVLGQEVAVLIDKTLEPGRYPLTWDGRTAHGSVASGVCFVKMETPSKRLTRKIVFVR